MFNIVLYYMHTEKNRMDKTDFLTEIVTLSGSLRESTSVISPSITIEIPEEFENDYLSTNYIYIEKFSRYYFINDIISISNKLWELNCSVDVLMSFKEQLGELDVFCLRNEYSEDLYLPDDEIPSELRSAVIVSPYVTANSGGVNIGTPNNPDYRPKAGDFVLDPMYTDLDVNDIYIVLTTCDGANATVNNKLTSSFPQCRSYGLSLKNLKDLALTLFTLDFGEGFKQMFINPADGIKSIRLFPFPIRKNITAIVSNTDTPIMFGSYSSPRTGYLISDNILTFWGGQIEVNNNMSFDFLNYEPYSKAQLYVPYYGYIDIELNVCNKCLLKLWYHIDITSGDTTIEILCFPEKNSQNEYTTKNFLYKILNCSIGIDIPISSSNFMATMLKGCINTIAGISSALMTSGKSVSNVVGDSSETTKINYSNKSGKVTSIKKTTTSPERTTSKEFDTLDFVNKASLCTVGSMLSINARCDVGTVNSSNSIFGLLQELHIVYRGVRVPSSFNILTYSHLKGKPSSYSGKLKYLKGYTELGGFHLEGLSKCTLIEQNLINTKLRNGFLMPDPE